MKLEIPIKVIDQKLKKKYRHNESMYRFIKGSIIFWVVAIVSSTAVLLRYYI